MHITHPDDASAPENFVPNYFDSCVHSFPVLQPNPLTHVVLFTRIADLRPLAWAYKFMREIARRLPHFRGEPAVLHPKFVPGGPASVVEHADGPIPFDAPRIVYSEEDERALEEFARANGA